MLCVPVSATAAFLSSYDAPLEKEEEQSAANEVERLPSHGCGISSCKLCSSTISYIGGFFSYTLQKQLKCPDCLMSLVHSESDPCPDRTLILMKNYFSDHRGLKYPSGSLCSLLYGAEKVIRKSNDVISRKNAPALLLHRGLLTLDASLFSDLQLAHSMDTADGTENHYISLVHLVLKKYIALRLKKIHKDSATKKKSAGNYLHRSRIFQNL